MGSAAVNDEKRFIFKFVFETVSNYPNVQLHFTVFSLYLIRLLSDHFARQKRVETLRRIKLCDQAKDVQPIESVFSSFQDSLSLSLLNLIGLRDI